jgi:hypothetical protein
VLASLLARSGDDQHAPRWTPRALTFLVAAADRWPHVRSGHLYPLLRRDPRLALDGGSAALTGLAGLSDVTAQLLESVKREFSSARNSNLQVGMAAIAERVAPYELSRARTAVGRARVHQELWSYLTSASQYQKSARALTEAIAIYRRLADPVTLTRLSRRLLDTDTGEFKFQLARLLINVANDLCAAGEPAEALAAAEESLPLLREVSGTGEAFTPELAGALSAQSWALSRLGRDAEALDVARELVDIRRRQGQEYPFTVYPWMTEHLSQYFTPEIIRRDRFLSDSGGQEKGLADSLAILATRQALAGDHAEAVASMSEALSILSRLAGTDPARHREALASAMESYGTMLARVDRHEDAAQAASTAVGMFRPLASVNSARYEPVLAHALGNYAQRLEELGRLEEAIAAARESFELADRYAAIPREAATAAIALAWLAKLRGASGDHDRAVADAEEAVARLRALAVQLSPYDADDFLSSALNKLAQVAERAGRHDRSLAADEEHVSIQRRIMARGGPHSARADRRGLAISLSNRTASLREAGRADEALASSEEALAIFRELAVGQPATYEPEVARLLGNIASTLEFMDREQDALPPAEESTAIYRRLAAAEPATYGRLLAWILDILDTALHSLGRDEEAAAALREAAGILRSLAAAQPGAHEENLARALKYLGRRHKSLGHGEEALAATRESAGLYRRLAAADPARHSAVLADVVDDLGLALAAAGQPEQALAATRESAGIYRAVIAAGRGDQREQLADELRRLASLHLGLGQHAEAVTVAQEAAALYRDLAGPLPELAEALGYVGLGAWHMSRLELAVAATGEAVSISERLAADDPGRFAAAATGMRGNLAIFQAAAEQAASQPDG